MTSSVSRAPVAFLPEIAIETALTGLKWPENLFYPTPRSPNARRARGNPPHFRIAQTSAEGKYRPIHRIRVRRKPKSAERVSAHAKIGFPRNRCDEAPALEATRHAEIMNKISDPLLQRYLTFLVITQIDAGRTCRIRYEPTILFRQRLRQPRGSRPSIFSPGERDPTSRLSLTSTPSRFLSPKR